MDSSKTLKLDSITIKFCGKGEEVPGAGENLLPVMMHACPEDFSTLEYFDVSIIICIICRLLTNGMNLNLFFLNNRL